ncbi:MAG: hypothetical protein E6I57_08110 [Chloroflexi bacterium]|nr:MAG: hypothetical protein E6J27_12040 [Chloroflexota bacterium]TMC36980.1 MAG: hypothetical protein E6J24_01290 [Chloroflexota bacterium]TMC58200.1 MAG: hypothetical protein E6J19_03935 [Chloroflexota bacterium]TME39063.1 MAG: hypothetical protein E6I57_08110 [Chloroflexota bacterium]
MVLLFALQALLIAPLFTGQFTQFRGSIEATFIANARFIAERFPDLSWYPYWYLGFPFELFYTPLLPGIVALLGKIGGDIPQAYRIVAATGYALGLPALYLAARELTRSRRAALLSAAAFLLLPSLTYAFPPIRSDGAALSGTFLPPPWRLVALVEYGEGPHVLSLSLALLGVAATIRYLRAPSAARLMVAVLALVAVALTNLIGALGVAILVFGIAIANGPAATFAAKWSGLWKLGLLTVLFSMGWYSLGFMRAFSQPGGGDTASFYLALPLVALAAVIAVAALPLKRLPLGADVVVLWLFLIGAIVVMKQLFGIGVAPQPIRYSLELDAAFAIAVGIAVTWAIERVTRHVAVRAAGVAVAGLAFLAIGLPAWLGVQARLAPDLSWQTWSERRVALWLADRLRPGERAFLTGDHAFWLNVFADVPQVRGGQDFSAVDPWPAHAAFQINTGADVAISKLWLQAFAVRYLVVTTPASSEIYRDFTNPAKFDGVFPMVFDERGVRIYEVPLVGDTRAVVTPASDLRAPTNGIDRPALESYVSAVAQAETPATVAGELGRSRVDTGSSGGRLVVRQAYDSGWRVTVDGKGVDAAPDALGMLSLPVAPGRHVIELERRVHLDFIAGLAVAIVTALALLFRGLRARWRRN